MRAELSETPESATARASDLRIGGLEKLSLVDWPGRLSATLFLQGCAWRCRYCHNPHLIPFAAAPGGGPTWPAVLAWLSRRRGLLDGVVFSGGEPTWQAGLGAAFEAVRELGFAAALHTGGPRPDRLERLLPQLAWVGFDFKAPFARYAGVTGADDGGRARASLRLLLDAGVAHEIRTTWHPQLLALGDLEAMASTLVDEGVRTWVIQRFRPDGCADPELRAQPAGEPPVERLRHPALSIVVR